jgi:hypothetical protein
VKHPVCGGFPCILDYNSARSEFIFLKDFLLFILKCMIILAGNALAISSITDLTDQREEQTEARLFFSVYSQN